MWRSFESEKVTFTASDGTKTEITNPKYNKSASQNTETTKDKQRVSVSLKVSETEQKRYYDVKADVGKESTSEIKKSDERKTKVVWLSRDWCSYCIMFHVLSEQNRKQEAELTKGGRYLESGVKTSLFLFNICCI